MAGRAGEFGPQAYADWRKGSLGSITENLERRLILRLAGELNSRTVLDVGCGDGALALTFRRNGAAQVFGCDVDPRMISLAAAAARHKAAIDYLLAGQSTCRFESTVSTSLALSRCWHSCRNPNLRFERSPAC